VIESGTKPYGLTAVVFAFIALISGATAILALIVALVQLVVGSSMWVETMRDMLFFMLVASGTFLMAGLTHIPAEPSDQRGE
jgi:uncharacterized membrane protein YidH (DUF202 family)